MRILHTSDWHLGQSLHNIDRYEEHQHFLCWLVECLVEHEIDALIVAGDIFDSSNPASAAESLYYEFLAAATEACPVLQIVVVAGNHDSAAGLDAPARLLRKGRVHVVGSLPRQDGHLDDSRLLVPLRDRSGRHAATVVAMPFLRPQYLGSGAAYDPIVHEQAVRAVFAEACEAATRNVSTDQALIATGHAYFTGGKISPDSERKIQCGNQFAVPVDVLNERLTYVALGHLHLAQAVGGRQHIRYCGSPLPLSLSEREYPHQVRLIEFAGASIVQQQAILVPRLVDIIRIPDKGSCPLDEVLSTVARLPEPAGPSPYIEVEVQLESPEPHLRQRIEEAIGARGRLLRLRRTASATCPEDTIATELQTISPQEVLLRVYRRTHPDGELPDGLQAAFLALVEQAQETA